MKLSEGEKLILVMLCDIYKALNLKGEIDLDALRSSIRGGKELDPEANGTSHNGHDREKVAAEVGEILAMWSAIEKGYKHLSVEEKREVEAGAGPLGRGVRFSGFDDDAEGEYRETANVLIETMGQFERFQGRNLSAHMPALEGYRRMLRLFGPMRPMAGDSRLGTQQIIALANAEKYAD
jgi:uncharacterized protein YfbU (UPF0304 family)